MVWYVNVKFCRNYSGVTQNVFFLSGYVPEKCKCLTRNGVQSLPLECAISAPFSGLRTLRPNQQTKTARRMVHETVVRWRRCLSVWHCRRAPRLSCRTKLGLQSMWLPPSVSCTVNNKRTGNKQHALVHCRNSMGSTSFLQVYPPSHAISLELYGTALRLLAYRGSA